MSYWKTFYTFLCYGDSNYDGQRQRYLSLLDKGFLEKSLSAEEAEEMKTLKINLEEIRAEAKKLNEYFGGATLVFAILIARGSISTQLLFLFAGLAILTTGLIGYRKTVMKGILVLHGITWILASSTCIFLHYSGLMTKAALYVHGFFSKS